MMEQNQDQHNNSSENECYSTDEQYFLDLCRFGQFEEIKQFMTTINHQDSKFSWTWFTNSGDNFVHMLAGNNFPQIFEYLIATLQERKKQTAQQLIRELINKQNSTGNTPLHYAVITESKEMLDKLLEYGANTNIENEFKRTPLAEAEMIQKFQLAEKLAPLTQQDIEKLKKQFGTVDICNEESDQSDSQGQKKQKQSPQSQKKQEKSQEAQQKQTKN